MSEPPPTRNPARYRAPMIGIASALVCGGALAGLFALLATTGHEPLTDTPFETWTVRLVAAGGVVCAAATVVIAFNRPCRHKLYLLAATLACTCLVAAPWLADRFRGEAF